MSAYSIEVPVDPHAALSALADLPSPSSSDEGIDTSHPDGWCPAGLSTVHVVITVHGRPVRTHYQRITSARPPQLARYSSR